MSARPSRSALKGILEASGIHLSESQYDALWSYHQLLRQADAELNLTRIRNFERMVLKHYVDSLLVLQQTDLPSPLVDMGSGAGLPGIPLKIAAPSIQVILAEPRGARAQFLRTVCESLQFEGAEVHAGKIGPRFNRPVEGVISRAVAPIVETLDRVAYCLRPGGRMLFMKGPDCDVEIEEARQTHGEAFRLEADHAYSIPGTDHQRRLVIYDRSDASVVTTAFPTPATGPAQGTPFQGAVREITSPSNPQFRIARDLLGGRGIRKHGRALIAGARIIGEVLRDQKDQVEAWLSVVNDAPPPETIRSTTTWIKLDPTLHRELDLVGTGGPLLMVRVPQISDWDHDAPLPDGCTLFVPFQDPENVGAVIRSAAAFGVAQIILLQEAAHPFHPKATRAAGPAVFQVPLRFGPSIQRLQATDGRLVPLGLGGLPIDRTPWPDRFGLVVGLEGPGLPEALRSHPQQRSVPIAPGVESLNAATAAAIALYAWKSSVGQLELRLGGENP